MSTLIPQSNHITIGWFGVPGCKEGGLTHLVNSDTDMPLCGTRLHPLSEYQWCSPDWRYSVECERCKNIQYKLADAERATKELQPVKKTIARNKAILTRAELLARIQSYLINGGFFNPEMMDHQMVSNLLIDCKEYFQSVGKPRNPEETNRIGKIL